jgi:hypothetical protein
VEEANRRLGKRVSTYERIRAAGGGASDGWIVELFAAEGARWRVSLWPRELGNDRKETNSRLRKGRERRTREAEDNGPWQTSWGESFQIL